jgi:hypothetical protein
MSIVWEIVVPVRAAVGKADREPVVVVVGQLGGVGDDLRLGGAEAGLAGKDVGDVVVEFDVHGFLRGWLGLPGRLPLRRRGHARGTIPLYITAAGPDSRRFLERGEGWGDGEMGGA